MQLGIGWFYMSVFSLLKDCLEIYLHLQDKVHVNYLMFALYFQEGKLYKC